MPRTHRHSVAALLVIVVLLLLCAVTAHAAITGAHNKQHTAFARAQRPQDLRQALVELAGGPQAWEAVEAGLTTHRHPLSAIAKLFVERLADPTDVGARRRVRHGGSEGGSSAQSSSGVSPFWRFVPKYQGSALLGKSLTWRCPCFANVTAAVDPSTTTLGDGSVLLGLTVSATGKTDLNCMSQFMFNVAWSHLPVLLEIETPSTRAFINVTGFTSAEQWVMSEFGVRMYTQNASHYGILTSMIDTALLFIPEITKNTDPIIMANNMDYLNTFAQFQPPVSYRANPGLTGVNESDIKDGDLIFASDMDGLGPSIALGSGGTPNHVAILLRDDSGTLFVCEATDPNIVCTPYATWIAVAAAVPRSVILAPLAPAQRAQFNSTAAWAFINGTVGFQYGYMNFVFGWVDTANQNFPCMPPDFDRCLVWQHLEYFVFYLEKLLPSLADKFVLQALNHRVNATGLAFGDVLQKAGVQMGLPEAAVISIPEQDSWTYDTLKDGLPAVGLSNVCSSYACNVLKHAGAFAGTPLDAAVGGIQCTEQSPWNIQALNIYDTARMGSGRPAVCVQRDPDNANCVLCGYTTFHLGIASNAKPLTATSGNNCPGINPTYNRSANC